MNDGRVLILCPMAVERRAVERALRRAMLVNVRVVQTGIGAPAITRAVERAAPDRPALMLLAGVCGGLTEVPDVPPLARIVDEHGGAWSNFVGAVPGGATLVGLDRIVDTPGAKQALALATGAAVVDMESHAFARRCEALGIPWGVVRGVSDTPGERLPAEILGWITPRGDTRVWRAVRDMALAPGHIPHIIRFARRSGRVLPAVASRVIEVIQSCSAALTGA